MNLFYLFLAQAAVAFCLTYALFHYGLNFGIANSTFIGVIGVVAYTAAYLIFVQPILKI